MLSDGQFAPYILPLSYERDSIFSFLYIFWNEISGFGCEDVVT